MLKAPVLLSASLASHPCTETILCCALASVFKISYPAMLNSENFLTLTIQPPEFLQPFPQRVFFGNLMPVHAVQQFTGGRVAKRAVHILVLTGFLHGNTQVHKLINPVLHA